MKENKNVIKVFLIVASLFFLVLTKSAPAAAVGLVCPNGGVSSLETSIAFGPVCSKTAVDCFSMIYETILAQITACENGGGTAYFSYLLYDDGIWGPVAFTESHANDICQYNSQTGEYCNNDYNHVGPFYCCTPPANPE